MSDTSVVSGDGSTEYIMNNAEQQRTVGCWTRLGANVCVGILAVITILLATIIIFTFYRLYQADKDVNVKGSKGKKGSGGSLFGQLFGFGKKAVSKPSKKDLVDAVDDDYPDEELIAEHDDEEAVAAEE